MAIHVQRKGAITSGRLLEQLANFAEQVNNLAFAIDSIGEQVAQLGDNRVGSHEPILVRATNAREAQAVRHRRRPSEKIEETCSGRWGTRFGTEGSEVQILSPRPTFP